MKSVLVYLFLIQIFYLGTGDAVQCVECKGDMDQCGYGSNDKPTCEGKNCYQYVYEEHIENLIGNDAIKRWWMRGCTEAETDVVCTGNIDESTCVVCNTHKCNNEDLQVFFGPGRK